MKKYVGVLFILSFFFASVNGQAKTGGKTYYNKDFKWTITIPSGFHTIDTAKLAKANSRGRDEMSKTYGRKIKPNNNIRAIYAFQDGQRNFLISNSSPFDTTKKDNYLKIFRGVSNVTYKTYERQYKGATLDSSYSVQTIDGLAFQTFKLVMSLPNNIVMNLQMFNRLFGKTKLNVIVTTFDKENGKQLLESWLNSKFDQ